MASDFELLAAWRAGDLDAGNALVRRHFLGLYAFVRAKVPEAADDLIQRVWEAAVQARDRSVERIAVTAGASTPSHLTREVIQYLENYQPAEISDELSAQRPG